MSAPTIRDDWREQLRSLKPGWDSYGGKPITEEAIAAVDTLAVVPCSNGGVQIEMHRDGWDFEVYFGPDGKMTGVSAERNTVD